MRMHTAHKTDESLQSTSQRSPCHRSHKVTSRQRHDTTWQYLQIISLLTNQVILLLTCKSIAPWLIHVRSKHDVSALHLVTAPRTDVCRQKKHHLERTSQDSVQIRPNRDLQLSVSGKQRKQMANEMNSHEHRHCTTISIVGCRHVPCNCAYVNVVT